jgi:hypothetical protein
MNRYEDVIVLDVMQDDLMGEKEDIENGRVGNLCGCETIKGPPCKRAVSAEDKLPFCAFHQFRKCHFIISEGKICQRRVSPYVDSFCYQHRTKEELKLEYDSSKKHVGCLCSQEVHDHPHLSGYIYRECTQSLYLPPILQFFLKQDLSNYSSIMRGLPINEAKELSSKEVMYAVDEDEGGGGYEVEEGGGNKVEDGGGNEVEEGGGNEVEEVRKLRELQWMKLCTKRREERAMMLKRQKKKVVTAPNLKEALKYISVSVPQRFQNKKGMTDLLNVFYKKELLARANPNWKKLPLRRWNMSFLAQMMGVRYRKYTTAVVNLYAKTKKTTNDFE